MTAGNRPQWRSHRYDEDFSVLTFNSFLAITIHPIDEPRWFQQ
jgi:hypothetical protein